MDLTNVSFVKANIKDNRPIAFFRRTGPLSNVTLPKAEYVFLTSNKYDVEPLQLVMADGSIVPVSKLPTDAAPEVVAAVVKTETVAAVSEEAPAASEEKKADEQQEEGQAEEQTSDEPKAEEKSEQEAEEFKLPENLVDTIDTTNEESISVHILTMEQYATYTKAQLLAFIKALKDSLPDDVAELVETNKNLNKGHLLEIIEAHIASNS